MKFVVKLAQEITIKTRPVRKRFVSRLHANIVKVLRYRELPADVVLGWDMLEVVLDRTLDETDEDYQARGQLTLNALTQMPGVAHILRVEERQLDFDVMDRDQQLQFIAEQTAELLAGSLLGKTFVVRCKRSGRHDFTSHDIERYVGAHLLKNSNAEGVQMRGSDITVSLEIKGERLFIVKQRVEGLGGYPLGCVGHVLSLISGGYDSSVASFDTIHRGMETHFCFFNLGGHAHEIGVKQVSHFLWETYASSHRTAFISVAFERVVEEILAKISNPYMGVVLKRMMMRAASQIAAEMNIQALVTGESVAQVSSQTLQNLSVIDQVTDMLTLRPLIAQDKTKIIASAVRIGVAEYAEHMPEYCAVISDKPTTAAKMDIVLREEKNFDFAILDAAVNGRKLTGVDNIYQQDIGFENIEQLSLPAPSQIVIDLRHEEEREKRPLVLHANKTMNIPFYKINSLFSSLDRDKEYLLYCEKGVMSRLHAAHLRAEGFVNVKVYRPAHDLTQ